MSSDFDICNIDKIIKSQFYFNHEEHKETQKNTKKYKKLRKIYIKKT